MARDEYDDERVVLVDRRRDTGLGMLLLGLAIGAGAALLLAPASGRETRERLQRGARRAGKRVRDFADDMGDEVTDRVSRVRDRTREAVGSRVEAVRDAVETRTDAVRHAVDVGRDAALRARAELERNLADAKTAYADKRRAPGPATADGSDEG